MTQASAAHPLRQRSRARRLVPWMAAALICAAGLVLARSAAKPAAMPGRTPPTRPVVFVANEEGTVTVLDARKLRALRTIDVNPEGRTIPEAIVELFGVNFVQDQDVSPDGRVLHVSRGFLGDVAAFDVASGEMLWRVPVSAVRADHMDISPDGRLLFVSDLLASAVKVVDVERRAVVGSFPTGDWAHDNELSPVGTRIYNASLGNMLLSREERDARPGSRLLTIADAETFAVVRTHVFAEGIRPFVLTKDERLMYAQLSFFHGIIEYDLEQGRMLRALQLPIAEGVTSEDYAFEAPHHGLALSRNERFLCVAGRASDYVAIVTRVTLEPAAIIPVGDAPSWAVSGGPRGSRCFVTNTGDDTVSVISYARRREIARIRVGDSPKHLEAADVPRRVVCGRRACAGRSR